MLGRVAELLGFKPRDPETKPAGYLFAYGPTVPADGAEGYATGCLFQHTDGGDGTALYVNEGDEDACDFNAVTVGA